MSADRTGVILRGIAGFYYVWDGECEYTVRARSRFRREKIRPMAGDRVCFAPGTGEEDGWITAVLPRRNELKRPPVSNIDILVIVACGKEPKADLSVIDKILIESRRKQGISVCLALSKSDIAGDEDRAILRSYRSAVEHAVCVSAVSGEGLGQLRQILRGCVSAFCGQSGAGKSSLLNALYGIGREVGTLSEKVLRGRNTTRECELIPVEGGGAVIDTPGFSLIDNDVVPPGELSGCYPEFRPYLGKCYYPDCAHVAEPGCAVTEAVGRGEIDRGRHERYAAFVAEMRAMWKNRYGQSGGMGQ